MVLARPLQFTAAMLDFDLLVVGAGPAGIAVAGEARCAGVPADRLAIIEKSDVHSAVIRSLYPDSKPVLANYKGIEAECEGLFCLLDCTKDECLEYLDERIAEHDIDVRYGEQVYGITPLEQGCSGLVVETSSGKYTTRVVVIAVGIFGRPKKPDYKLPRSLKDRVHFEVTTTDIENEDVLVVGGGDSASEYCQHLITKRNRVTLSYRRTEFARMLDANRIAIERAEQKGTIDIWRGSSIVKVEDDTGRPGVVFDSGPVTSQRFDRIVYALGGSTPEGFLSSIGVHLEDGQPIYRYGLETNVRGVYLTGDLAAGKKGGSIVQAFNTSRRVMRQICDNHLGCTIAEVG